MKPLSGAQLYTLREHTRTLEDVAETLRKVRAMGYRTIQVSGFGPMDPRELARVLADSGLEVAITHMPWPRFLEALDAVIEEHHLWKCRHTAIGSLPAEYYQPGGLERFVNELQPVAARLAAAGLDFSYHNHSHELARYDGSTWLQRLYELLPPELLKAELDTYWIQAGGGDVVDWIGRCAGRMPVIHLKDMAVLPDRSQRMAPLGEGNLCWKRILPASATAGVEYLLVEQDDCYGRDPFEELAVSRRFLESMGYP